MTEDRPGVANRLDRTLGDLAHRGEKALIAFLTAGDPDPETSLQLLEALVEGGADVVELGLPFSDPLADGPVIQQASTRALAAGTRVETVFRLAGALRVRHPDVPVALLTYVNPVLRRGVERFMEEAAGAGIDALVIPDLPPEETGPDFTLAASRHGLHLTPFAAPTTTEARLTQMAGRAGGFVYCVSVTGVTGARREVPQGIEDLVARIRRHTDMPVAVGFGIATPEQAARVAAAADGVIVGSALVKEVETAVQAGTLEGLPAKLRGTVSDLKDATGPRR